MKIEIGESLCYSFLRHVKHCWLVQTNWRASENWPRRRTDVELEALFGNMRREFDPDGSVFKGTRTCGQFLKQGEIDVLGVEPNGNIHAIEVAYHEAGLNYGGGAANRVMKKLLRTVLTLDAYHPEETERNIYFASPKVNDGVQQLLQEIFNRLRTEYRSVNWQLLTNEDFTSQLLTPTLERAEMTADTSELFVRSAKLLQLSSVSERGKQSQPSHDFSDPDDSRRRKIRPPLRAGDIGDWKSPIPSGSGDEQPGQLQPLVRSLMKTLLEDYPRLLSESVRQSLMDPNYCRDRLGLRLNGLAMLRPREEGRRIGNRYRYWEKVYSGRYYVTNNWWKQHHCHNAESLLRFVERRMEIRAGGPGVEDLERHRTALRNYLSSEC